MRSRRYEAMCLPSTALEGSPLDGQPVDFRFLAEYSTDLLCSVGMDRIFRHVSPSCVRMLGWTQNQMIGKCVGDFYHPEDFVAMLAERTLLQHGDGINPGVTVRVRSASGVYISMDMSIRLVKNSSGEPLQAVLVMRDATERLQLQSSLIRLAFRDELTGLVNRRGFNDALRREWKQTLVANAPLSLLMIDLDGFKEINDSHGHLIGDACLQRVATQIKQSVDTADIIARYGGEEIAVILPSQDCEGAAEKAEKVRAKIEDCGAEILNRSSPRLTVSIGIASAATDGLRTKHGLSGLVRAADKALYRAKHKGRNRVEAASLS